jgi:pimeloyl-ACP methyl ester carboxylesterase
LTIIAIHGNGGGAFRFQRVYEYLPADIEFRAMTLPGFDGIPADPSLRTMRHIADYLHGIIMEASHPVVALGSGIGAALLLEYSQHYADTLDGMILHAPVGARLDTRWFPRLMRLPGVLKFGQWLFASSIARPVFKRLVFVDDRQLPPELLTRFFEAYRRCAMFGQMFELITAEWFTSLQPITTPAALLWGDRERVLKVEQVRDYQKLLLDHTVRIVPGWDHFPMLEQPEAFTQEIVTLARQLTTKR